MNKNKTNHQETNKPLISFDYAIKYLLRDKHDFDIVEGFISALLQTKGYKPVKIVALLESESNKEDRKSKRSIADMIVEDQDHYKYIIEIERNVKDSFIHKACFTTSRLIIDSLGEGQDFTQIMKVFYISLLYFPIGNNNTGAIYHGKTIIHEVETDERLSVHIEDPATGRVYDATNILPEYFYISIPLFNGRLEKKIDDWLYVMKYGRIPSHYHSKYMKQVAKKLDLLKMNAEEQAEYYYYLKKLYSDRDELQAAEAKGKVEGKVEEKIEIAKNLLKEGCEVCFIQKITGLSVQDIDKLRNLEPSPATD